MSLVRSVVYLEIFGCLYEAKDLNRTQGRVHFPISCCPPNYKASFLLWEVWKLSQPLEILRKLTWLMTKLWVMETWRTPGMKNLMFPAPCDHIVFLCSPTRKLSQKSPFHMTNLFMKTMVNPRGCRKPRIVPNLIYTVFFSLVHTSLWQSSIYKLGIVGDQQY